MAGGLIGWACYTDIDGRLAFLCDGVVLLGLRRIHFDIGERIFVAKERLD